MPIQAYKLKFMPEALKEWNALDGSVKSAFKKSLHKRLSEPRVPGAALHGELIGCYKIKLNKQGYRLVYTIEDDALVLLVIAVDKREDALVYRHAARRKN